MPPSPKPPTDRLSPRRALARRGDAGSFAGRLRRAGAAASRRLLGGATGSVAGSSPTPAAPPRRCRCARCAVEPQTHVPSPKRLPIGGDAEAAEPVPERTSLVPSRRRHAAGRAAAVSRFDLRQASGHLSSSQRSRRPVRARSRTACRGIARDRGKLAASERRRRCHRQARRRLREHRPSAGGRAPPTAQLLAAGEPPPPVYRTRLPPPATLRYEVRRGLLRGTGEIRWRPAGDAYRLVLEARIAGLTLLTQTSEGAIDATGLAPVRLVDQRARRSAQAANFSRDSGKVTFSGPTVERPLLAGTQDRLSWMIQLAGIVAAEPELLADGRQIAMVVVGARGEAEVWVLRYAGREIVDTVRATVHARQVRSRRPLGLRHQLPRSGSIPARDYLPVHATLRNSAGGVGVRTAARADRGAALASQALAGVHLQTGAGAARAAEETTPCTCSTTRTASRSSPSTFPRRPWPPGEAGPGTARRLRDRRQVRAEGHLHRGRDRRDLQGRRRGADGKASRARKTSTSTSAASPR